MATSADTRAQVLEWSPWREQAERWPAAGRHILAQFDEHSIVVYQAYRPEIATWAVAHQAFGGPWSLERMSWIKPNFLWMMYRSGWATKPGQERVLAVRMKREGFDEVLRQSVESSHHPEVHGMDYDTWRRAGKQADVRLQWDPDHGPSGDPCERRAVQLGLRGATLRSFATEWIVAIADITAQVDDRRDRLHDRDALTTPTETVYRPTDPALVRHLRLSEASVEQPSRGM
jgi:hypothetical protein